LFKNSYQIQQTRKQSENAKIFLFYHSSKIVCQRYAFLAMKPNLWENINCKKKKTIADFVFFFVGKRL
jgi:hypothetical protein